jgi:hypothetical protein
VSSDQYFASFATVLLGGGDNVRLFFGGVLGAPCLGVQGENPMPNLQ